MDCKFNYNSKCYYPNSLFEILRAKLRVNYKLATKFQDEHESSLITYLYSGSEDEDFSSDQKAVVKDLKSCVSDPFQRKLLVSTLLKLRNEILW